MAGVKNDGLAFDKLILSPRWTSANTSAVNVTVNFPASNGYIAYKYKNDVLAKQLSLQITGSGSQLKAHVLLPQNAALVAAVTTGNKSLPYKMSTIETSKYVDFELPLQSVQEIFIKYE